MKTRLDIINPDTSSKESRQKETRKERIIFSLKISPCSFILEEDANIIDEKHRYDLDSGNALTAINELALFFKYGLLEKKESFYLIVHNIDLYSDDEQTAFLGLAKDRGGYSIVDANTVCSYIPKLPDDIRIVFTISNIDAAKKVLLQLRNLGSNLVE